jgi:TP901 family phage tail tape measure protein
MANSANFEASLRIKAGVEGTDNIDKLAESIADAGVDVTHLTDESAKLAKQFGEIEQKQALITQFRELKKATSEANTEWQAAQAATAAYTSQIETARDSLEALEVAMRNQGEMSQEEARATQAEYNAMVREIRNLEQAQANQATRASQLSSQYDDLNSRLVATRSAMHDVGLSTTGLNDQQRALAQESQAAQTALGELTAEAERLNAIAQARVTLGIDTDDNARRQIEEVTAAYETLRDSGTLSSEELARANQLHTARVAELEAQLGETAPTLETLTEEFGKVTAAAGGLAYVTNAAMEFETAMSGVKKVVDGTPEQIQALSAQIQQMSIDMGMGTDAIAEIAAQGGQLGIPIEKLGEFTKMAGQMSVAFGMTAEDAGDAAAKIANVFGLPIEEVGKLGDAINTLGNTSAAKESEIVDVMQRIGGQAKQFGLATEQAAALSAAFISLGKSPEVAGTAINALLTKLQTANVQSDDFKEALAGIGINANKLADDINANPQQALSNFLKTLSEMDKQQRSVTTFKLFGQEYVDDVNALVGGLDTYNKALDSVKDKSAIAGAMQKEFNAKMDTSAQSIDQAKQSINVLAQTVGKELLPVVSLGAKAVGGIAQGIGDFAESHPILTKIAVVIASAQVALIALNSTMTLAGAIGLRSGLQVAEGAAAATTGLNAATVSATRLNAAMGGLGAAAGGVVGVAASLNKVTVGADLAAGNFAKLATQAFAVTMAFDAGESVGDWLYKNSDLARGLGDHLAMIPAAIHSISTTGNLDQFRKNFETSEESAKRLAAETKNVTKSTEELAAEQAKAASAAKLQADANLQLANDIKLTEANLEAMKDRLAEMEAGGQKNTQGYKNLSTEIEKTTDKLAALKAEAEKKGIGELLKTDLDKTAESFKALGLDVDEFATGIDGKATDALNGFVDVAHLADGDIRKLALAYNAAKDAVGDNQAAQDELNNKLNQVTEGNTQLAEAIKKAAKEQKEAKSASEEQAAALDKLGVSVVDANNGMSKGGMEMISTLKAGVVAIKEQSTSATALKTSLQQAFETSIAAAKTKGDFVAIKKTIDDAGVASSLTADQLKILNAGIAGGGEAAKASREEIEKYNKSIVNDTKVTFDQVFAENKKWIESQKSTRQAYKETGDAAKETGEKAEKAQEKVANSGAGVAGMLARAYDKLTSTINSGLQSVGVTSEQVHKIFLERMKAVNSMGAFVIGDITGFSTLFSNLSRLQKQTEENLKAFNDIKTSTIAMTQSLGDAAVTTNDLGKAQLLLHRATGATYEGIAKIDNATLDNLKRQIDSTKQKFDDLSKSAKDTADGLQTQLARLKGDDTTARQLEQTKKLAELQERVNEARKRGNTEEIAQLQRAFDLQKQINDEENRQASVKLQQEQQAKQANAQKQAQANSSYNQPVQSTSSNTQSVNAKDVANSFADLIEQAKKEGANLLAQQLMDEAKRLAR